MKIFFFLSWIDFSKKNKYLFFTHFITNCYIVTKELKWKEVLSQIECKLKIVNANWLQSYYGNRTIDLQVKIETPAS